MVPDPKYDPRKETQRLFVLACVVATLLALLHFTPLKQWLSEAQNFKARVSELGWKADLLFMLGSVLGISLGLPRLALCALGGVLFGFVEGLFLSQISGVAGAYGTFLITRYFAPREWVQSRLEKSEKLKALLATPTIGKIFVARQMPVPGVLPNVLLGVLSTSHQTFLWGTFLGYLPSNIPVALAGSSMGKETLAKAVAQVSLSMVALGVFSALVLWMRKRTDV